MKLPPIHISLPVIFVLWCLFGVYFHGMVMLAYPAMWGLVALGFFALNKVLGQRSAGSSAVMQPPAAR